jgi:predicted glutamine amidotransferase
MCNLCGIWIGNNGRMQPELVHAVLAAQLNASKVHSDGFGYFFSTGLKGTYGKTSLAARYSGYPKICMAAKEEDVKFLITHTRKASSGKISLPPGASEEERKEYNERLTRMSHPFLGKLSVLAHNGTMNSGVESMDSMLLAEKFEAALEAKKDIFEALKEAFSFFKDGYASLIFAVKYAEGWYPYFYKGNKPLSRFVDKETGTTIIITDESYIANELLALRALYGYTFEEEKILKEGIYSFETLLPLQEVSLIKAAPPVTTVVTQRNYQPYGHNSTKCKGMFDTFVERIGKEVLVTITQVLLTKFTPAEVLALTEHNEEEMVKIMELIKEEKVAEAKALLA